ncbi:hypothetical protein [Streptomyces sp. NPDC093225]|uniref:hypothetical protein n=1 Tax=Streptomyces sp. NPDC093225 TaxID=3366034 RepID=UPI0038053AC9
MRRAHPKRPAVRRRRWAAALAVAVLAVAAGTASADTRPAATSATVVLADGGSDLSAADTPCFKKSIPNCASSDPNVAFKMTSNGDTSACTFSFKATWGDGATTSFDFNGGPNGSTLAPVKHEYTKPSPFLAPKSYTIAWTVTVRSGATCHDSSGTLGYVRTCTAKALSGSPWVARFPTRTSTADLADGFRGDVDAFVRAMRGGGISVTPEATRRPVQRAYMMHYAWLIWKKQISADKVPAFKPAKGQAGVDICWQHTDANGTYDKAASLAAATAMVKAFKITGLKVAPSLTSLHVRGLAIDMSTTWSARSITVTDHSGRRVTIATTPHSGLNTKLIAVGRTYGVIHYSPRPSDDATHWSTTGH